MRIREILDLMESIENREDDTIQKGLAALQKIISDAAKDAMATSNTDSQEPIDEGKMSSGLAALAIAGLSALSSGGAAAQSSVDAVNLMKGAAVCSGFLESSGKNSISKGKRFNDQNLISHGNNMINDANLLLQIAVGTLGERNALAYANTGYKHNNDTGSKDHTTAMECFKLAKQVKDVHNKISSTKR